MAMARLLIFPCKFFALVLILHSRCLTAARVNGQSAAAVHVDSEAFDEDISSDLESIEGAEASFHALVHAEESEEASHGLGNQTADSKMEVRSLQPHDTPSQHCMFYSSATVRRYHFQLQQFAAELIRSPRFPRLMLYPNQSWVVRLTGDVEDPLDWMLSPIPGKEMRPPLEIDFAFDTKYIEKIEKEGEPNGLRIVYRNGTSFEFTGGLYLIDQVLSRTVRSVEAGRVKRTLAEIQANRSSLASDLSSQVGAIPRQGVNVALSSAATGGVLGTLGAYALTNGFAYEVGTKLLGDYVANSGWQGTLDSMNWALRFSGQSAEGMLEQAVATETILIGNSPAQILSYSVKGGALGAAGGLAAGLVTGLAIGAVQGITQATLQWIRNNRNLKLTASDKIFDKLHCHSTFLRCDEGRVLVPKREKMQKGARKTMCRAES